MIAEKTQRKICLFFPQESASNCAFYGVHSFEKEFAAIQFHFLERKKKKFRETKKCHFWDQQLSAQSPENRRFYDEDLFLANHCLSQSGVLGEVPLLFDRISKKVWDHFLTFKWQIFVLTVLKSICVYNFRRHSLLTCLYNVPFLSHSPEGTNWTRSNGTFAKKEEEGSNCKFYVTHEASLPLLFFL